MRFRPKQDGLSLLEKLRREWPEVISLVMSRSVRDSMSMLLDYLGLTVEGCFTNP